MAAFILMRMMWQGRGAGSLNEALIEFRRLLGLTGCT